MRANHRFAIGLDITQRKQAEEALRESRALLRAVIDAVPATIRVKDGNLCYVLVNEAFANYPGLPVDAFPGKTPGDFYAAPFAAEAQARDAKVLATGEPTALHEVDHVESGGRMTRWLNTSVPLRDVVIPGGMSGRQLAAATRRKRPDVKILLTSGFPDKAADAGAGDRTEALLSKPYRQQELARKLREILGA